MQGQSEQKKDIDATKQKSLLHMVLYMTKRQLPDVEFQSLVDLQKANGCTSLSKGQIYTHHSSITEMKASLASVAREQQTSDMEQSPFVSIMIDKTVNITDHKKLIIFVRIVKDGSPRTLFLGNYTVTSGTAECVFDKVQEVLHARGIDCQKVIGFDSDGAPIMFGRMSGAGVRLAGVSSFLTHIHCVAHRCVLVASNAALHTNKISDFRTTVNGEYKLVKYSAVRYERLRQLHAALDQRDFQSLKEPCSVRRLSLSKATESISANWTSLMLELEEESARGNATATGL